jgi:hypothetical protein
MLVCAAAVDKDKAVVEEEQPQKVSFVNRMVIKVADLLHDPACADNDWDEDDEFVDDVR